MNQAIDKLRAKKAALEERLKTLEAKQKSQERKTQTRRKIILGAMIEERMQQDPAFQQEMLERLDGYLKRNIDRDIFNLKAS